MARKLEFDYNQALECATKLFWAKGYSNTSLRDLLERMEIGEGSFYNIFKSKKNLYLECLKHYNESVTRRRLAILDSEKSVKKAIRKFFHLLLDELDDPETPRICLMAGSLSTDVLEIPSIQSYVIEEMNLFEKYLFERLAKAREEGELSSNFESEVAAQVIVTYLQGFFRVVRVLKDRDQMLKQIDSLLAGLGL